MPIDYDEYDDYQENLERRRKKGGGGKKRDPFGNTSRAARNESIENARQNRIESSLSNINKVVKNLHKGIATDGDYVAWVNSSLKMLMQNEKLFVISKDGCSMEAMASGKKGGQNANKVASAVRLTHNLTQLNSDKHSEQRDQPQNIESALEVLRTKLIDHLKDWETVLTDGGEFSQPDELTIEFFQDLFKAEK